MAAAGSSSPRLDANLLLQRATGWTRTELLAHPERGVGSAALGTFRALLERRVMHEPMAYILGEREFFGRVFRTDRRALIPRPETELLVELGIAAVRRWRGQGVEPRVVDVGTGSGAVAVSVAAETGVAVVASDVSWDALTLARENAAGLLGERAHLVGLVQADLLGWCRGGVHVLLANLPYIPSEQVLPPDVAGYEPPLALFSGLSGMDANERVLRQAASLLEPGGELALELDETGQAAPLADLAGLRLSGADVTVRRDAHGDERVLLVRTATPGG